MNSTDQFASSKTYRKDNLFRVVIVALSVLASGGLQASDLILAPGDGVTEPVALSSTVVDRAGAVSIFDFVLRDQGLYAGGGYPQSFAIRTFGTISRSELEKIQFELTIGDDRHAGTLDASDNILFTFEPGAIVLDNDSSLTFNLEAYFKSNTDLTDGATLGLRVEVGSVVLLEGSNTFPDGSTSMVESAAAGSIEVEATKLVFSTQPAGSVSSIALTTQPVVAAVDEAGNVDKDFDGEITLSAGMGSRLSIDSMAAEAGIAEFSDLAVSSSTDGAEYSLLARAESLPGGDASSSSFTVDIVGKELKFLSPSMPLSIPAGKPYTFSGLNQVVVAYADDEGSFDADFEEEISLIVINNAAGSATLELPDGEDLDISTSVVTRSPDANGLAMFNLTLDFTLGEPSDETFNLQAYAAGVLSAISPEITATVPEVKKPPVLTSLAGDRAVTKVGESVALDLGGDATVADEDSDNLHGGFLYVSSPDGAGSFRFDGDTVKSMKRDATTDDLIAGTVMENGYIGHGNTAAVVVDGIMIGATKLYTGSATIVYQDGQEGRPLAISFDVDEATPARIQALVRGLRFTPAKTGEFTVNWRISDGDDNTFWGGEDAADAEKVGVYTSTLSVESSESSVEPVVEVLTIDKHLENASTLYNPQISKNGSINGGTLSGLASNAGTISNVNLTPGTIITGGQVSGKISGTKGWPARITGDVLAGTELSHVTLRSGSTVSASAKLGEGVVIEEGVILEGAVDLTDMLPARPWAEGLQAKDLVGSECPGNKWDTILDGLHDQIPGVSFSQGFDSASLRVEAPEMGAEAYLLPVSVQTAQSELPMSMTADGNVALKANCGKNIAKVEVMSLPVPGDPAALAAAAAGVGASFSIDEQANLLFESDNEKVIARMDYMAYAAEPGIEPGISVKLFHRPGGVVAYSHVFLNEVGIPMEQDILPTPADWPALRDFLRERFPIAQIRIDSEGLIEISTESESTRLLRPAYEVTPATDETGSATDVGYTDIDDVNGDGLQDILFHYPNGESQIFYLVR